MTELTFLGPKDFWPPDPETKRTHFDVRREASRMPKIRAIEFDFEFSLAPPVFDSTCFAQGHYYRRIGDDVMRCLRCGLTEHDPGFNDPCCGIDDG